MSTKSTLAHDDTFHFYRDVMDEDHVYIELRTTRFEVTHGCVTLALPLPVWETIRHLGAADLSLVDKTDEDLLRMIEIEVDRRIADYLARHPSHPGAGLARYAGSLAYGPADSPRHEQIQHGLEYVSEQRQQQRELRDAIDAIRRRTSREQASG